MLIDQENKIIFIAAPKAATTSITEYVLSESKKYIRNRIFDSKKNMIIKTSTHISIKELKDILGPDFINYKFYCVIREPEECMISKYNFLKYGRGSKLIKSNNRIKLVIVEFFKSSFSKLLPYNWWILFYPIRVNIPYVIIDGEIPNNLTLITFESFKENPSFLFKDCLNIDFYEEKFIKVNVSNPGKSTNKFFYSNNFLLKFKFKEEKLLYKKAQII